MARRLSVSIALRPDRDVAVLFATRGVRLFAYGLISVVLVLYLAAAGLPDRRIGALLTGTLLGDAAISLWMTTRADRLGRRRMLVAGAGLMLVAAAAFTASRSFWLLVIAAVVGVISPAGSEVGPFLAIEQAALSQRVEATRRVGVFAWYSLTGSIATALGALSGGALSGALQGRGVSEVASYRFVILAYGALGLVLGVLFTRLTGAVEATGSLDAPSVAEAPDSVEAPATLEPPAGDRSAPAPTPRATWAGGVLGLRRSRAIVLHLSLLFSLDAFAGGFIVQSLVAWWFHRKFGAPPAVLGWIFFGGNLLAGVSALSAGWLARRIGLVNTMVFTHLPSNLLLIAVPFMPTLPLAIAVLLARFSISQMDVPTRQAYVMAVVDPAERAAAGGVTGIARTIGASLAPAAAAPLFASGGLSAVPFVVSGGLKIVYDLLLYRGFRSERPRR
ncbi:MAG TPA: MFS transporter [Anaeromyxobacteraceae bacterium]|nr:MFS transporter [Anaeromyxobacteraceae bacterium]